MAGSGRRRRGGSACGGILVHQSARNTATARADCIAPSAGFAGNSACRCLAGSAIASRKLTADGSAHCDTAWRGHFSFLNAGCACRRRHTARQHIADGGITAAASVIAATGVIAASGILAARNFSTAGRIAVVSCTIGSRDRIDQSRALRGYG